jgi:acetolactate synthase-1/2/3 large subunit
MVQVESPRTHSTSAPDRRTLTGGEAVVASLKRHGIDTIFGLPGIQLDGLFKALYDDRDAIRVIHTRHEQATAYMADGYARVTGREGVCLVVPGPGLLNTTAALSTAYACNSPVLCLTGQIKSDKIEGGTGQLHEIPNQLEMIRSVTKHAARATTPGMIPGTIAEAFRQLRTGRSRPVEVEIPPDTLFAVEEVELGEAAAPRQRSTGDPDLIDRAAKLLGKANSPLIYTGGGILRSAASAELLELAELLQAPVIMSRNGRGAISDRHFLAQGPLADPLLRPDADVVLAIGTRFMEIAENQPQAFAGKTVIQLDIDETEIGRNRSVDLRLVADAKAGLAALLERIPGYNRVRASREQELLELKAGIDARLRTIEPQYGLTSAIRAEVPDEGIIVGEMTQIAYFARVGLPVYLPNTHLTPGYQGTLGCGFTIAMGAKVGKPDVPVVSINGDGGFGFTLNELSTLVQHKINLVTIVFNDHAYGNVRRIQDEDYDGRILASDLVNPDYPKLAEAFGVAGRRAEGPDQLRTALRESINADEPTLIEVPVPVMPNPWKRLARN